MGNDERKDEIIKALSDIEFRPSPEITKAELSTYRKFPLADMSALGVVFSTLPEAFRTVTQTIPGSGEILYRATDVFGNPAVLSQLFNDGTGLMGSARDTLKGFTQFRFHSVSSAATKVATTLPFDPTMLFMAAALMQINAKLEAIQETQQEMFDFMKREKRTEQQGDLKTLVDILNNFKFNWDNELYKNNKHNQVQLIRQRAEQNTLFYRDEIASILKKYSLLHLGKDLEEKSEGVSASLKDYQLALYLYSFSSFLELMLLGNFNESYLNSVSKKLREYSIEYRTLYSKCYDQIEDEAKSALEANILGGIAFACKMVGRAVEKTPIGSRSQINEALIGTGQKLESARSDSEDKTVDRLINAKADVVFPFIESVEEINKLYNQPMELLTDGDALYLMPIGA